MPSLESPMNRLPRTWILATTLVASSVVWAEAAASNPPPARYALREDIPDIGTNIRREVMRSELVPIDSSYAQLTPEERARWRGQYEGLPPDVEPPFPQSGLQAILRQLLAAQKLARVSGPFSAFAQVDEKGEVTSVSILVSPDKDISQAAATAVMRTRFKPALCGGKPCAMQFPLRMTFVMDNPPDAGRRSYVPRD